MAPEQVTSSKTVDRRADVWSLGACLFEMITGQPPFRADNLLELGAKIVHEAVTEVRALRPDVPPELEHIVHRCLQKKPENRYADAAELSAALEEYLHRPTSDPHLARTSSPMLIAAPRGDVATMTGPFQPLGQMAPMMAPPPSSQRLVEDTGGSQGTGIAWGETRPRSGSRVVPIVLGLFGLTAVVGLVLVGLVVTRGQGSAAPASSAVASAAPPPAVASEMPADKPAAPTPPTPATASAPSASASTSKNALAAAPHPPPPSPTSPTATPATRTNTSPTAAPRPSPAPTPRPAASHRAFDHL
jgi:serine/threonine-protein kinase